MITDEMVAAARNEFVAVSHESYFPSNEQIRCVLEAAERAAWRPISEAPNTPTWLGTEWKPGEDCLVEIEFFAGPIMQNGKAFHQCSGNLRDAGWVTHWRSGLLPPKGEA